MLPMTGAYRAEGPILVGGPDSYYHLRRMELARDGGLAGPDEWINYPEGQEVHWPDLYDRMGGWVLALAGPSSLHLLPVILGLAASVLLLAPDRPRWGPAWFVFLPAVVFPTSLGAIDHHCLEPLLLAGAVVLGGGGGLFSPLGLITLSLLSPLLSTTWPVIVVTGVGAALLRRVPGRAGLAIMAGAALAVPVAGWSYFANPWLADIPEAQPLISNVRDFFKAVVALSPGFLLLLPVLPLWWPRRREPMIAGLLAASVVALPLALIEARFVVYLALPCAFALAEGLEWLARRRGRGMALALGIVCAFPVARGLAEIPTWPPDPAPEVVEAMGVLRDDPSAGDFLDPETRPAWCTVAAWDLGPAILQLGRAPVMANAFHTGETGRATAHRILFLGAEEATRLADEKRARYLFLTDLASGGYAAKYRPDGAPKIIEGLFGRLYFHGGAPGWRMIYGSRVTFEFEGRAVPAVQIWERDTATIVPNAGEL